MKLFEFRPKLFSCLKGYSKTTFTSDLMAGIIVGIVALPLAIAFGIASGVTPERVSSLLLLQVCLSLFLVVVRCRLVAPRVRSSSSSLAL